MPGRYLHVIKTLLLLNKKWKIRYMVFVLYDRNKKNDVVISVLAIASD